MPITQSLIYILAVVNNYTVQVCRVGQSCMQIKCIYHEVKKKMYCIQQQHI